MRIVQFVMGPAGSGKSSFCDALEAYFKSLKRNNTILVNFDPAAEDVCYTPQIDIRNLVSLEDSRNLKLGPNGGLVFCFEYLSAHLNWLKQALDETGPSDDEYFIIDCPGQIELFTHVPALKVIINAFKKWGFQVCGTFLVDAAMVVGDISKYLSAILLATSAMVSLEIPWLNLLSKVDLIEEDEISMFCNDDYGWIRERLKVSAALRKTKLGQRINNLNSTVCSLIEDFSMVQFHPVCSSDPDSLETITNLLDIITQYGEDAEPTELPDEDITEE